MLAGLEYLPWISFGTSQSFDDISPYRFLHIVLPSMESGDSASAAAPSVATGPDAFTLYLDFDALKRRVAECETKIRGCERGIEGCEQNIKECETNLQVLERKCRMVWEKAHATELGHQKLRLRLDCINDLTDLVDVQETTVTERLVKTLREEVKAMAATVKKITVITEGLKAMNATIAMKATRKMKKIRAAKLFKTMKARKGRNLLKTRQRKTNVRAVQLY